MKLQQTINISLNENLKNNKRKEKQGSNAQPSFKGGEAATVFMNFLQTSPAVGATLVDAGCMGFPRSAVDFTRSPEAGMETFRREFSSTGNDALLGVYGLGAATLLAGGFNNKYNVKANKLFISDDSIDVLSQIWADVKSVNQKVKERTTGIVSKLINKVTGKNTIAPTAKNASKSHVKAFLEESLASVKGYVGGESPWIGIDKNTRNFVVNHAMDEVYSNSNLSVTKGAQSLLRNKIIESTGVEDKFMIEHKKTGKKSILTLDEYIDSIVKMAKTFANGKVAETFNGTKVDENLFIKGLKSLNKKTAILGLGIAMGIGLVIQPLNVYLTKRKTGKSGFVGGGKENDSTKFKMLKVALAALGAGVVFRTIGKNPKAVLKNVQFKSLIPTLNQFKVVYGATILSRILSSRNENELRETTFKDSLGYANWLIFGGFVSKFAAMGFEKFSKIKNDTYLRYNEIEDGKGLYHKVIDSTFVTRNEVLVSALKKLGVSTIKKDKTGKEVAMTMKEMILKLKELKTLKGASAATIKEATHALSKVRNLGIIQMAGYIYSGTVLGYGIPKLNIAMTKALSKHKKHEPQEIQAPKVIISK